MIKLETVKRILILLGVMFLVFNALTVIFLSLIYVSVVNRKLIVNVMQRNREYLK